MSRFRTGSVSPTGKAPSKPLASLTRIKLESKGSFGVAGDLYTLQEVLGEGSYGSVYRCLRQKDQAIFAVKVIDPMRIGFCGGADAIRSVELMAAREVDALRQLSSHPGIISLEEAFFSEMTRQIFIVTEFVCGGHLFSHVVTRTQPLQEPSVAHIVAQLSDALSFCHALGIVHRDLKLENVLVASVEVRLVEEFSPDPGGSTSWSTVELFTLKICDFGFAKSMKKYTTRTPVGTSTYAAPELGQVKNLPEEVLVTPSRSKSPTDRVVQAGVCPGTCDREEGDYDAFKADAFSLGVMTFVMLCLAFPDREGGMGSHHNHKRWHALTPSARSLLDGLLVRDPQKRFGIAEVINHEWVRLASIEEADGGGSPLTIVRKLSDEALQRQKSKNHIWSESERDWQRVVFQPRNAQASTLQDSILQGLLAMHRALVLVQQERGMACWALAGASGLDGISCWDQLRWHIQLSDKRLQEAMTMLQKDGSKLKKVDALATLRLDLARARQFVLAVAPSCSQTDDIFVTKRLSSDLQNLFDSVFSAYNSACDDFVEVVAQAFEAVLPDTSAVRKAARRYRLFSAAAEQLGRERAFICGGVHIIVDVDLSCRCPMCDHELGCASAQACAVTEVARVYPEKLRRLLEILGARKVLLGSATQGNDIVSISTGLLSTLLGDDEPRLLSQAEIGALEAVEEQVLSGDLKHAPPVDEWYRTLTRLVNGIHSRIAMGLVDDVRALGSNSQVTQGEGTLSGVSSPGGRALSKSRGGKRRPSHLWGCAGCHSGLRCVLQAMLSRLN